MNIAKKSLLTAAILLPGLVLAHAHLEMSVPAANSSVSAMPPQIVLHFSEATKLTALSIQKEGGKEKQVLKVPAETKAVLQIAAPKLAPGVYILDWRGLSDDSHVANGTVRFTVTGK